MGPRMFKTAKTARRAKSRPDIWSEGKQFAPVDAGHLSRVASILARRSAARVWLRGSVRTATLALAVEDGLGAWAVAGLGRLVRILPSRGVMARTLARMSRLQATASELVDHHAQPVAPLELGDLSSFMEQRRAEARQAPVEQARKDSIASAARERAALLSRRKTVEAEALAGTQAGTDGGSGEESGKGPNDGLATALVLGPVEVIGSQVVAVDEMMAIRMALSSVPEVAPALTTAPLPALAPTVSPKLFATRSQDWSDLYDPPAPPEPPESKAAMSGPGLSRRIWSGTMRLLRRGLSWSFRTIWRLIGPILVRIVATGLGWGLVATLFPYGIYGAVTAHLKGQDLRYFD